ncbi:hypothetical protein, partial [Paenibacillus koleovorans]|uniref:hypothetical protein n=1 Tax=Paenibacillus koleovorans TaxID=121608 RepID=UPI0013E315D5
MISKRRRNWKGVGISAITLLLVLALGARMCSGFRYTTAEAGVEAEAAQFKPTAALDAKKQLIVSVPEFGFADWDWISRNESSYPHLFRLWHQGGLAAISARTLGKGLEDVYATIGAGAPAGSGPEGSGYAVGEQLMDAGIVAERLYARFRGMAPAPSELIVPRFASVEAATERLGFRSVPGLLGQTLREWNVPLYVYGNADGEHPARYAVLALADRNGMVAYGDVSAAVLEKDELRAFGVRMFGDRLLHAWRQAPARSVFLVEWGDWSRWEEEKGSFGEAIYEQSKNRLLEEFDHWIGQVMEQLQAGEGIWLFSPGTRWSPRVAGTMAPLVYYQNGMTGGCLMSASTRRAGIVTLYDLAPSLLMRYTVDEPEHVLPSEMIGHRVELVPTASGEDAWTALHQQLEVIRSVYVLRPKLLLPFAGYEAIVLLAALLVSLWWRGERRRAAYGKMSVVRPLLHLLLFSILVAPFVMLLLGWVMIVVAVGPTVLTVLFFVLLMGLSMAGLAFRRPVDAAGWIGGVTAGGLLVDGYLGAEGIKRSLLGYDPVVGARFYGMGNEYMGVLLGALVLGVSCGLEHWRREAEALRQAGSGAGEDIDDELAVHREATARQRRARRARGAVGAAAVGAYALAALYLAAPQLGSEAG